VLVLESMTGTSEIDRELFELRHDRPPSRYELAAAPSVFDPTDRARQRELLELAKEYVGWSVDQFTCPKTLAAEFIRHYEAIGGFADSVKLAERNLDTPGRIFTSCISEAARVVSDFGQRLDRIQTAEGSHGR
jgi:hypothetical protein